MLTVEKSVVINQSIEKVFKFASNAENEPLWRTEIQESKVTSDGPFGVGSTVSQTAHFMGRRFDATAEITEYEKNRNVAWKMTSGGVGGVDLTSSRSTSHSAMPRRAQYLRGNSDGGTLTGAASPSAR